MRVAYEAGPTGFGLARALAPISTESLDGRLAWLRYRPKRRYPVISSSSETTPTALNTEYSSGDACPSRR